jgi:hypothetical protein
MGIDAAMFVRIKGRKNWLADGDELKAAYEMASTLGSDKFFISEETEGEAWAVHHALSIVRPMTAEDAEDYEEPGHVGKVVWHQDGEPIVAEPDEQFIKIHLWSRYYGEEYARGDWPTIRAVAEWLELRFPTGEVWYGGDSSGVEAAPLNAARRDELNRFYLTSGRKSYTHYPNPFLPAKSACMCPRCQEPMMDCGGGGGDTFFCCDGCGRKTIRKDASGAEIKVPRGKEFFDVSREERARA